MDSDGVIRNARRFEEESKWDDAAVEYCKAIQSDSSSHLYEKAAWCLSRAGKYSEAIKFLLTLCDREPKMAKWPYMLGYQYYSQKNWNDAIEWFEKALQKNKDYFVVKYRLSYAYVQLAGEYKKLTKPEYWKALGHLKDCHRLWNDFSDKNRQKESGIYYDICFLHGKMLMGLENQRAEAISLFLKALEIKSDDICKYNLAKTYYLTGDYQKAKQIIPLGSQFYIIELDAHLDAKLGDYDNAIKKITKLLQTRQKDYLFCFLAEVYLKLDELTNANNMIQEATAINKTNHKNFYVAAKIYYKYGLLYAALSALDTAVQLKSQKYEVSDLKFESLQIEIRAKITEEYHDDIDLLNRLMKKKNDSIEDYSHGIISSYNSSRGFGFIKSGPRDVFFHVSGCKYKDICNGDKVAFKMVDSDKGPKAVNIIKTKEL